VLKEHPEIKVVVEGHTCLHGGPVYNMNLSRKRAEKVKAYLVQEGIAADRLTVVAVARPLFLRRLKTFLNSCLP
jgi:outer membrane protein OmpA-like peptidoglycan-associated protein